MIHLPSKPLSLVNLVKTTFQAYPTIFRDIWLLVVLSAAVHLVIPWFFLMNITYGAVVFIGFVLFTWFLYTAIICSSSVALHGGHMKLPAAFRLARQRYLFVLGSNLMFFAIGAFLIVIEFALTLLLDLVDHFPFYILVSVGINVFIFVTLYFAIPLIALEKSPVLRAFEYSFRLVKHNWWRTFIVLFIVAMFILGFEGLGILFTGKSRLFLFTGYHFIAEIIFYPLIISATLILLNDLKLRHSGEGILHTHA